MKLSFKGYCPDMTALPKSKLPENAVKFIEPENEAALFKALVPYMIPPLLGVGIAMLIRFLLQGNLGIVLNLNYWWIYLAYLLLCFLGLIVHEFLHAICFPKKAEVDFYISATFWFIYSITPVSKRRFIALSLLPNIVLGLIPLMVWIFVSLSPSIGTILFTVSATMFVSGCGDYMNSWNAFRQMPRGSVQQGSGMNSYWFIP